MKNYETYHTLANHWSGMQFPVRPSPEEIRLCYELLTPFRRGNLLILGSTPELRDIGFEMGMHVTCADINPDMLHGMKQLMKNPNEKEKLVECNWLSLPFAQQSFSVVAGDHSNNIIPFKEFATFYTNVRRVLKADGVFINHVVVSRNEREESGIQ